MCGNCCAVFMQTLAVIFSAVSTFTIINSFGIKDSQTRVIIIISFAIGEFIIQCCKLCLPVDVAGNNGIREILFRNSSTNTKAKAVVIGLVDATFDVITAVAILNGVDFQNFDVTSYLIALGTFIGLGEEVTELIIETLLFCVDRATNGNSKVAFAFIACFGTIEIIGTFVEVGVSMYIAAQVSNAPIFVGLSITILSVLLSGLFVGYAFYVAESFKGVDEGNFIENEQETGNIKRPMVELVNSIYGTNVKA